MDSEKLHNALIQGIVMGIPGLSVAIGTSAEQCWMGSVGYRDLIHQIPVRTSDRFGIGSITKTFVARVILQLVQEGKLSLEGTARDYLDLAVTEDIPNTDRASLRQLLNHQSGIPNWEFQKDWIRNARGDGIQFGKLWDKTETLDYIRREDFKANHEPGERYAYSNTNYTLLGLIIESITGNDLGAEIRTRILEPLEINGTYLESFEEIPRGYVHHYHYATEQYAAAAGIHPGFSEVRPYLIETTGANLSPEWAAGGMVSTCGDLLRWAQALKNGRLLSPELYQEAFTYYPPYQTVDEEVRYLQGIYRIENYYQDQAIIGHGGAVLGFSARMFWLDEAEIIVVLLANVGEMHSGLKPSPISLYYREVLLPAVMDAMGYVKTYQ